MELKITTDLKTSIPSKIEWNFGQLKVELTEKLEYYDNLIVTEDSIKSAKSDKSKLTKLSENINRERLLREREYMKPFDEFKDEVKEIINMITSSSSKIDVQIKAFDDDEKNKKFADLTSFYVEQAGDLLQILPLEKVLNPKWANKGESMVALQLGLEEKIKEVKQNLSIICSMNSEFEVQIKNAYLRNINMSEALIEKSKLDELQAIEQRRQQAQREIKTPTPIEPEQTRDIKVIFYNTTAAFRAQMKLLTEKHNIKYGGVK